MTINDTRFLPQASRLAICLGLLLAAQPAAAQTRPIQPAAASSAPVGWRSTGSARPAAPAASNDNLLGCLITPNAEAEIGSPVVGVLAKVLVERGDRVKKGQLLAQLIDDVERAATQAAERRHENRADVEASRHTWEFAQKKAERAEELFLKNFISSQARDQAVSEAKVAAMKYAQSQELRLTARKDMEVARAQLGLRSIVAPFAGVVAERRLNAGERVEDKAILKLVQIDPLRVEVVVPSARFNQIRSGTTARVMPDLPGASEAEARVTLVDAVIDAASNTFRVRLELPNPGGAIPAGLRCKVNFSG